jgi:hypothetical protein
MINLKFTSAWPNATSPISLVFGEVTGPTPIPPVVKEQVGIISHLAWQPLNRVSNVFSFSWSLLAISQEIQCHYASSQSLVCENLQLKWQSKGTQAAQSVLLSFNSNKIATIHTELEWNTNALAIQSINLNWKNPALLTSQSFYTWRVNPEIVIDQIKIDYGPSDSEYICVWKNHPKPGLVIMTFSGQTPVATQPLDLKFSPTEKICYFIEGGGLLRAHDDLPVLDRKISISPQLRSSYIMQPTITCVRVRDNLEILITSFNYQMARTQFAATCSVKFCSKVDYNRSLNELLKITVNGYDFHTTIEQPSSSLRFNAKSFSGSGRSRLSELSSPKQRPTNYTNTVAKTLAGLMSDIVLNSGWTIDSSKIIDYAVPALAFSYNNKTPAEALKMCADGIGAMLKVNDITKVIEVIPKWPVMPWDTETAVCDVILNSSVILQHDTDTILKNTSNVVFVRGEQLGVHCKIKQSNTLADLYASDVIDQLITHNQGAVQRGSCELANTGDKEQSTIRTKIMPDLPPITPGMLIGIQNDGQVYKATCDSISISASVGRDFKVTVNQTMVLLKNV